MAHMSSPLPHPVTECRAQRTRAMAQAALPRKLAIMNGTARAPPPPPAEAPPPPLPVEPPQPPAPPPPAPASYHHAYVPSAPPLPLEPARPRLSSTAKPKAKKSAPAARPVRHALISRLKKWMTRVCGRTAVQHHVSVLREARVSSFPAGAAQAGGEQAEARHALHCQDQIPQRAAGPAVRPQNAHGRARQAQALAVSPHADGAGLPARPRQRHGAWHDAADRRRALLRRRGRARTRPRGPGHY